MVQALNSQSNTCFSEPGDDNIFISLGFAEEPRNSLITRAEFTPSKIGGEPAWITKLRPKQAQLTCD